jgi:predicted transposase/invertase (TIGR01784 family)
MAITEKYIDPFTDFGFKHIFGSEENKNLLISFLNDLLDIDDPIVDITYRNLEKLGLNIIDRKAVFDVYCTDSKKNNFIVELQRSQQKYFKDRSLYYTTFPIQEQAQRGDWDYSLKKVYFVGILEFVIDKTTDDYLTKVQLCNTNTKDIFYDKLAYYYIEMPKFKKTEYELKNHLEYWLYTLNNMNKLKSIPTTFKNDKYINQAFDVAEFLQLDKEKQFAYQHDLKTRLDYKNAMDYAIECATKQGLLNGLEQGIEQGIEQEKINIAKNLLDILDNKTISLKTGLGIEVIEELR